MGFSRKGFRESKRKAFGKYKQFQEYFEHLDFYQELAYKIYTRFPKRLNTLEMIREEGYHELLKDKFKITIIDSLLDELYDKDNNK